MSKVRLTFGDPLQGDFHHWVPLFNCIDDFFEKCIQSRPDVQLDVKASQNARQPFPAADVIAILEFTATVLENCSNKHLYGSHDVSPQTVLIILVQDVCIMITCALQDLGDRELMIITPVTLWLQGSGLSMDA